MRAMRNSYKILTEKHEGKRTPGRQYICCFVSMELSLSSSDDDDDDDDDESEDV
jgi:hypothetical protein